MTSEYMQIIRDHKDQILIEVGAHDHIGRLAYHTSNYVMNLPDPDVKFEFHNLLVAPGLTPNKGQNPGIAMFEVDNGVAHNLKFEFLDLGKTYGSTSVPSKLTFYSLDFASRYGVQNIDATGLVNWRKALEADINLTHDYMVRQVGFDPSDKSEYNAAMAIYADEKLVTSSGDPTCFVCQMHKSITGTEEKACCASSVYSSLFLQ